MLQNESILILGASTRAAAYSAARAGLRPCCLDYFADVDLKALCPVVRVDVDSDIERLAQAAGRFDSMFWMYTGAIEGRPDLVERLSRRGGLLGNPPDVLRRVRDPWQVSETLRDLDFLTPALRPCSTTESPDDVKGWLIKSTATAGGMGVAWGGVSERQVDSFSYLQEFMPGPTFSGLFVAGGGSARLLGVAGQERNGPSGSPFLYRGSVAPWEPSPTITVELRRLGEALAAEFRLVGLFGVDFLVHEGRPWVVEINPRYTASVELFEDAMERAFLEDHYRACVLGSLDAPENAPGSGRVVGKRILYAERALEIPPLDLTEQSGGDRFRTPRFADVPAPGTRLKPGEPILTFFATAETPERCLESLDRCEDVWRARLDALG